MSVAPDSSFEPIERLVSLNWDHPLPSAVVALTLQPQVLTLVAPKSAAESANALRVVLGRHRIEVDVQLGDEATDLDAGNEDTRMRAVISRALNGGDGATLDYTGGSKLMAAIARLELEPGGDSRAIYLDPAGTLRWDDGRTRPAAAALDIAEIGELHGYEVLGAGGKALSSIGFRSDVLSDARGILESAAAGRRPLFWEDVVALGRVARGDLKGAKRASSGRQEDARSELSAVVREVVDGQARMLPLGLDKEGDWLEILVADRVELALSEEELEASVRLGVEARLGQAGPRHAGLRREHPAIRRLVEELRRCSAGRGSAADVTDALDDLLHGDEQDEPASDFETDFELDVVVLRGHRVHALSCFGGSGSDLIAWKSREIARRVTQFGGDFARPGFVCLLDRVRASELESELRASAPGISTVRVFGVDDLLDWTEETPRLGCLRDFLRGEPMAHSHPGPRPAARPEGVTHDLLATVGATPLPVFQAILAHGAQRPLLLHDPGTAAQAERISTLLARRGVTSIHVEVADAFRVDGVDPALQHLPPSDRVDVTGGTKVLSTRVLLKHARERDLTTATYVDGRQSVLRCLSPNGPALELPRDVRLEEMLELRGWRVEACERIRSTETVSSEQMLAARDKAEAVSAIGERVAHALGDAAEVVREVRMVQLAGSRTADVDLLVRQGHAIALFAIVWSTSPGEVLHVAWPRLLLASDALGDYARVVFVTKLGDDQQRRVERRLRRRSAGAAPVRVLGRSVLERKRERQVAAILDAVGVFTEPDAVVSEPRSR
jgi:hypothetical protein